MNQPPPNSNFDESTNGNGFNPQAETTNHQDNETVSPESLHARKNKLKRFLFILIGIGLSIGLILSVGMVILLNKLGLTKKPHEIREQKTQPIEQIRYQHDQEIRQK